MASTKSQPVRAPKSVRDTADTISKIKSFSIKISNRVLELSKEIAEEDSSLLDDFIDKFKESREDSDDSDSDNKKKDKTSGFYAGPYEEVVPSREEAKIVMEKALFRLSKIPRKVILDIKPFEHDILKGKDYIVNHTSRYPFLSAIYNGDYYGTKGNHALLHLLKELKTTKKTFEDEDEIVNYAHTHYVSLYKLDD